MRLPFGGRRDKKNRPQGRFFYPVRAYPKGNCEQGGLPAPLRYAGAGEAVRSGVVMLLGLCRFALLLITTTLARVVRRAP